MEYPVDLGSDPVPVPVHRSSPQTAPPPHHLTLIFCGISESGISTTISSLAPSIHPSKKYHHRPMEHEGRTRNGDQLSHLNLKDNLTALNIIDLPGFLCGDDKQEAINHSNIQILLRSRRQSDVTEVTVVLYFYPAAEVRMGGSASTFRKSLRILQSHNIVKTGERVNCIVLVTNTNPSTSVQVLDFMEQSIRTGFQTELQLLANEAAKIPIVFLQQHNGSDPEHQSATKDQISQQIMGAIGQVVPSSIETLRNLPDLLFMEVGSNEDKALALANQHDHSVEFLRRNKLIGPAAVAVTSPASERGRDHISAVHIGQGAELSNPLRLVDLRPTAPSMYKVVRLTEPAVLSLASAVHKKQLSWYTFHVPVLELVVEDPEELLQTCERDFINSLHQLSMSVDENVSVDSDAFFHKWGTHLVVREEHGGTIQILVKWTYMVIKPSDEMRVEVGQRLKDYLDSLLLLPAAAMSSKLELPTCANLQVTQLLTPDGDGFIPFPDGELNPVCLAEWVQARQQSPMYLQQPVPVPVLGSGAASGPNSGASWLLPYSDCFPSRSPQAWVNLSTKTAHYYAKLNRAVYDPRRWVGR